MDNTVSNLHWYMHPPRPFLSMVVGRRPSVAVRSIPHALCFALIMIRPSADSFAQATPISAHEDVRRYAEVIRQEHVDPFTCVSRQHFDSCAAALDERLSNEDRTGLLIGLLRLTAMLNDEHTMVRWNARLRLPIQVRTLDEDLCIIGTDSAHRPLLLHRVIAINDVPASSVLERFAALVKQDNPSYAAAWLGWNLCDVDLLMGLGIITDPEHVRLGLLDMEGDTVSAEVHSIDAQAVQWVRPASMCLQWASRVKGNYGSLFDDSTSTLYVNYRRCREDENISMSAFTEEVFARIEAQHPARLVIDLRENGGGSSALFMPFIKRLRKGYLNKENRIRVLIGRGTFSSAVMNAVELKRTTSAVLIGEVTGGNVNHYGEVREEALPWSGFKVLYSTKHWVNWPGVVGGLKPDEYVGPSIADVVNGSDAAIERAIDR